MRVREILMREWDPIGVADIPEAADEYDSYVGEVYVMLMDRRATQEQIAAYLYDIAANHMDCASPRNFERSENTAAVLIAVRSEFETH